MVTTSPTRASPPTAQEEALARESRRALSTVLQTRAETQEIEIRDDQGAAHSVRLPVPALRLLVDALTAIGEGNAVSTISMHAELTTAHRRVRYQDVIAYKERIDGERSRALETLAEPAQTLKRGYERSRASPASATRARSTSSRCAIY